MDDMIEDIPMFWKNRVSKINRNDNIDEETMIQYKIQSVLNFIYFDGFPVDSIVEEAIISQYLKVHPSYSL